MPDRDAAIDAVQRELTAFARRARTTAARLHPDLSLVSYSILDLMHERGGCRAADLAAHFMLDKSTVSRQIAALDRMGLLVREADPDDHRGQTLRPSEAGIAALAEANRNRRAAFDERFRDWDDADILRFSAYMRRYNES